MTSYLWTIILIRWCHEPAIARACSAHQVRRGIFLNLSFPSKFSMSGFSRTTTPMSGLFFATNERFSPARVRIKAFLLTAMHKFAYVTLLTKNAYLPGALVLDQSLRSVGSAYPLVVMVTPAFPEDGREVLRKRNVKMIQVDSLMPADGQHTLSEHDARSDTSPKPRIAAADLPILPDSPIHGPN